MNPINQYQFPPENNEPIGFSRGFSLVVIIILLFVVGIICSLVFTFQKTTDAANAKLTYLAAQTKAIEFAADNLPLLHPAAAACRSGWRLVNYRH